MLEGLRDGLALSTIVNPEKQHTAPRFGTIRKLAAALGVEPFVLMRGEDYAVSHTRRKPRS